MIMHPTKKSNKLMTEAQEHLKMHSINSLSRKYLFENHLIWIKIVNREIFLTKKIKMKA